LLHDYPSRWSLDLQPHNRDLAQDGTFEGGFMGPYEALWARNVPVHVLPLRGDDDLYQYKIVIAPAINLLSRDSAERLEAYVHQGRTLIATARVGPAGRTLFLLNHNEDARKVTLPEGCADALTDQPTGQELELGPREVRVLVKA
jgi:beta-galactosidase GanA